MNEFLSMGGYGGYVWTAYGVTVIAMGLLFWRSVADMRKAERRLGDMCAQPRERHRARRPKVVRLNSDKSDREGPAAGSASSGEPMKP